MKVLFTVKVREEQFQKIKDLGYDVVFISEKNIENSVETDNADILVAYNPFERLDISKMKNLKYIMLISSKCLLVIHNKYLHLPAEF